MTDSSTAPMPNRSASLTASETDSKLLRDASVDGPSRIFAPLCHLDWLGMSVGFLLCLTISCIFGHRRIFWEDEMLGWMLLHDPSWHHMVSAWNHGADGGGFTFYLTGRAWFALFGASALSFRLYSATCFGLAFCVTWITARRVYPVGIVAFALFNTWFFSPPLVSHMAEGRFYGLLMLAVALAAWLTISKTQTETRTTLRLCISIFLVHGLLTTSHVLGVLYSAVLLVALLVPDVLARRSRPLLYLSGAAAWLLLIPERTALLATAGVGKPWFWTTPPTLSRFFGAYCGFSAEMAGVLFLLGLCLIISLTRNRAWRSVLIRAFHARPSIYIAVLAFCLVPVGLAIESTFATSLFINRYLMPLTIGQALLTAELLRLIDWHRILPSLRPLPPVTRLAGATCFGVALLAWVFGHLIHFPIQSLDYPAELTGRLPHGIPVVCEDAWVFTEIIGRQHASGVQYTYLLDWAHSTTPTAPKLEVTQYHLMEKWKNVGYFSGSIDNIDHFLASHPRFLILHWEPTVPIPENARMIGNPLLQRFAHDPGYEVKILQKGRPDALDTWLVCRGSCAVNFSNTGSSAQTE